jgi:hypothetical protein
MRRRFGPVWAAMRMRDLVTGPKAEPSPLKGWEERAIAEGTLDREKLEKDNRMRSGWPMVNGLHMGAERGVGISGYGPAEEHLGALCEFVPMDSPSAGKPGRSSTSCAAGHGCRIRATMRGVYFPAGGPAGLAEFEQAVRGKNDDGGERQAAE